MLDIFLCTINSYTWYIWATKVLVQTVILLHICIHKTPIKIKRSNFSGILKALILHEVKHINNPQPMSDVMSVANITIWTSHQHTYENYVICVNNTMKPKSPYDVINSVAWVINSINQDAKFGFSSGFLAFCPKSYRYDIVRKTRCTSKPYAWLVQ